VSAAQLSAARGGAGDALYRVEWARTSALPGAVPAKQWAVLGADDLGLTRALTEAGVDPCGYADLAALRATVADGGAVPDTVVLGVTGERALAETEPAPDGARGADGAPRAAAAHRLTARVLADVQAWLADDTWADSRLVLVTSGAVAAGDEHPADLAAAPLWGLLRAAQTEHPGRFALVDLDGAAASRAALPAAVGCGEPQLALRAGQVLTPRLTRHTATADAATGPDGAAPRRLDPN
ncbi:hypothetical protein, partial [Streptomyces sp. AC627_RSS907]